MPAQTESERKTATQKSAASRKSNQRKSNQAQRAVDTSIGAAITARDRVADAAKPLTSSQERKRKVRELRDSAATTVRKAERRGVSARKRAVRSVEREAKRVRRAVTDRVRKGGKAAEERVEQGAEQARSTADEALREASDRVGDLKERVEPDGAGARP